MQGSSNPSDTDTAATPEPADAEQAARELRAQVLAALVERLLRERSWHSDGAPTALSWQAQAQANPWPLGQDPMLG